MPNNPQKTNLDDSREVTIAVMGGSGTGKSTFINLASGSNMDVGAGLRSCTSTVNHSKIFDVEGYPVRLIDTPGFDDTLVSDTDILKLIASYFARELEQGRRLSGVIYMHRISDVRMGGTARKNFAMFRKLCGEQFLGNVAIVTNMWSAVSPSVGEARENELCTDDLLYKPVLEKGARILRHDGTQTSAQNILRQFLFNPPLTLRIQQELVEEKKDITETAACGELDRELEELKKRQQQELEELQQQLREAKQDYDAEAIDELEGTRKEIQDKLKTLHDQRAKLSDEFREMSTRRTTEDSSKGQSGHRRREAPSVKREKVKRQQGDDISELRALFEEGRAEEAKLRRQFEEAEERHRREIQDLRQQLVQVQVESKRTLRDLMTQHAAEFNLQRRQTSPEASGKGGKFDWFQTVTQARDLEKQKRKGEDIEIRPIPRRKSRDTKVPRSPKSDELEELQKAGKASAKSWTLRLPGRPTEPIDAEWQMVITVGVDQRGEYLRRPVGPAHKEWISQGAN